MLLLATLFVLGMQVALVDATDRRTSIVIGLAYWLGVGYQERAFFPEHPLAGTRNDAAERDGRRELRSDHHDGCDDAPAAKTAEVANYLGKLSRSRGSMSSCGVSQRASDGARTRRTGCARQPKKRFSHSPRTLTNRKQPHRSSSCLSYEATVTTRRWTSSLLLTDAIWKTNWHYSARG